VWKRRLLVNYNAVPSFIHSCTDSPGRVVNTPASEFQISAQETSIQFKENAGIVPYN
jgi:hypothetical protein